ncbi:hypothetical protein [Vibrio phage R01]|nr:hypothetical protein [Vibrio phage R01]
MGIRCFLFGHKADAKRPNNVNHMFTPTQLTISVFGEPGITPPIYTGYTYMGEIATCTRCGEDFDATWLDIPVLQPKTPETPSGEPPWSLNDEHRQLYLFWLDVTKKHACADQFITRKQISYLWRCIYKITNDREHLTQVEKDTCNDIIRQYWRNKKAR